MVFMASKPNEEITYSLTPRDHFTSVKTLQVPYQSFLKQMCILIYTSSVA